MTDHRIFASIYDRILAGAEKGGLREMRAELVGEARGRTLELGVERLDRGTLPKTGLTPWVRPLIRGSARPAA